MPTKRILIILQTSPYGGLHAQEGLDAIFAASIFEQEVSVLFLGDGVYQLLTEQNPSLFKSQQKRLQSLALYDVNRVYACRESLSQRGLTGEPRCIDTQLLAQAEIAGLIKNNQHILSF